MIVPVITDEKSIENLGSCALCELRIDYWKRWDIAHIADCLKRAARPCIVTLRPKQAGGRFSGTEAERLALLQQIMLCNPAYVDVEDFVSSEEIDALHAINPQVKLIRSFHDFNSTPQDLSAVLQSMQHPAVSFYKIATLANSTLDALRLLQWLQGRQNVIGLCMGEYGSCTRILARVVGCAWTYVPHGEEIVAPGMLSAQDLQSIYRVDELNSQTRIFALIGDPVEQSDGHLFHNQFYREKGINAVYVKYRVRASELTEFFQRISTLPIDGLSVTMPLKESVLPFVDHVDELVTEIGATNTLFKSKHSFFATNTDVAGVLQPLLRQTELSSKNALIIGAGGAAKAVAYALKRQGAKVSVINRTLEKAQNFAKRFAGRVLTLDEMETHDLVINTLPDKPETRDFVSSVVNHALTQHSIAMDIVYKPKETTFIQLAKKYTDKIIYGEEMFLAQAQEQALIFRKNIIKNIIA